MDKPTLLKGGIVLTLDRAGRSGLFDVIIRNGKIAAVDYDGKTSSDEFLASNPGGEVIDAAGRIIMPGFFNSRIVSAYALCKMFFRKCSYDNNGSSVSLNLIDRYLAEKINSGRLSDLIELVYNRSLMNGELFVNESSPAYKKFQINDVYGNLSRFEQYLYITAYDLKLINDPGSLKSIISAGFRADEDINSYSISSLKKSLNSVHGRLVIDASFSNASYESVRQTFGKPYINVLAENGLLNNNTLLMNPLNITEGEIGIIKEKESAILFCPSDYANMSGNLSLAGKLSDSDLRIIMGTGMTGSDILTELKIMSAMGFTRNLSFESLIRTATTVPAGVFGIGNVTGSIERTKSADMIIFSLRDIRNSGGMPDLESETICWHIISSLTTKDITGIFLRGRQVYSVDNKEAELTSLKAAAKIAELSSFLYSAGKLKEYKERKLMENRVKNIEMGSETEEAAETEVFVDMTETGEYMGEGEFKILGNRIEEFRLTRETAPKETGNELLEIKSFDLDLNLIGDDEEAFDTPKLGIRLVDARSNKNNENPERKKSIREEEEDKTKDEFSVIPKHTEHSIPVMKKSALKFGFKEGE